MDGLIALLVIIGIANALTSKKKKEKQAQKRAAQAQAFENAIPKAQSKAQSKPKPRTAPRATTKVDPLWSRRDAQAQQQRIPFTREEWKAYLSEMSEELVEKRAASAPAIHDEGESFHEGFISTQGESAAEHDEHRRRIEEAEAQYRAEREALDDLRSANRQKLRAAVVMSEVLGKPVALRQRIGYHR